MCVQVWCYVLQRGSTGGAWESMRGTDRQQTCCCMLHDDGGNYEPAKRLHAAVGVGGGRGACRRLVRPRRQPAYRRERLWVSSPNDVHPAEQTARLAVICCMLSLLRRQSLKDELLEMYPLP